MKNVTVKGSTVFKKYKNTTCDYAVQNILQ